MKIALGAMTLLLALANLAAAHQSSVTYGSLSISGDSVSYTLKISSRDLYEALALGADRPATETEVLAGAQKLSAYVLARVHFANRTSACTASLRNVATEPSGDGFYAALQFDVGCVGTVDQIALEYELFFDLDKMHESRNVVSWQGARETQVLEKKVEFRAGARNFVWSRSELGRLPSPSSAQLFRRGILLFWLDLGHIELLLLIIIGTLLTQAQSKQTVGTTFPALKLAAVFAVGVTLSMAASALGAVHIDPQIVRVTVALSVIYWAAEEISLSSPPHFLRIISCFGFGVVHGTALVHAFGDVLSAPTLKSVIAAVIGSWAGILLTVLASLSLPLLMRKRKQPFRRGFVRLAALSLLGLFALRHFYR